MQSADPLDEQLSKPVNIATLNLFNYIEPPSAYYDFENIYTHDQWRKKQAWISDFLSLSQPDIIGFQEVFSPESLAQLTQAHGLTHFAVIDKPQVSQDYIYRDPVVALASRFPIEEVCAIKPATDYAVAMGLRDDFAFSRQPIRASIILPDIGMCDVYVVHFKSKRPAIEPLPSATAPLQTRPISQRLAENAMGQWASSIQRGSEAALLFHAMMLRRSQTNRPMILMGDFNDSLLGGVLSHLTTAKLAFDSAAEGNIADYPLRDAFDMYLEICQAKRHELAELPRPATHYYGATGTVLDYILLSSEFDASHSGSLAEVRRYLTFDRHLVNPEFERDSYSSDHAPVMVSLSVRR